MKGTLLAIAIGLAAVGFGAAYAYSVGPQNLPTFGISLPK